MKETAEDILKKHATGWTSAQKFWKRQIIAAMEEYATLKSKEIADKASTEDAKETFMKEQFKPA